METLLLQVEQLLPILPKKDAELAQNLLKKRDFENIRSLVRSNIYKTEKNNSEGTFDDYLISLEELDYLLVTYMSYVDTPEDDFYNDY